MISEELEELTCALSDDEHFLIKPIELTCGHYFCQECKPEENIKEIRCKICNVLTTQDFGSLIVSDSSQQILKLRIGDIFEVLEAETTIKLNELKDKIKEKDDILNVKFNYILDEIDIRVESIRIQVEESSKSLKEKVEMMRNELLNSVERTKKLDNIDLNLKELKDNIEKKINLNEDYLDNYQKKIKELKKLITEIDQIKLIKFTTKTLSDEDIIGKIYSVNKNDRFGIEMLKSGEKGSVQLTDYPHNFIVLPDDKLVIANFQKNNYYDEKESQCITLYDESFNFIKQIVKINNDENIFVRGFAVNQEKSELYILEKKRIIVTDFDLNFIKYFGSEGEEDYQFNDPEDICFKDGFLYVTDCDNQRIQIFNYDLEFVKTLDLNYTPYRAKASNKMLGVTWNKGIKFYELNNLKLVKKFDWGQSDEQGIESANESEDEDGDILYTQYRRFNLNVVNSVFYSFDSHSKIEKYVYCYDQNGNFIEKISLNHNGLDLLDNYDGKFIFFNENFMINSFDDRKLIIF